MREEPLNVLVVYGLRFSCRGVGSDAARASASGEPTSTLERANLRERTNAGLKAAREKGVRFGRPSKLSEARRQDIVRRVGAGDLTAADPAGLYGDDPSTVARVLKRAAQGR